MNHYDITEIKKFFNNNPFDFVVSDVYSDSDECINVRLKEKKTDLCRVLRKE